ncbi:MAG: class I SAM-dependent methyltransferase [Anaerolineales bacterium]|jgi:ubiquinone/menaquinone biosynthesis C-methylase UbiE
MSNQEKTEDIQSFERRANSYEKSPMQWLFFDRIHRALLSTIPAGIAPAAIVDIGCGTGRLLRKLAARWPEADLIGVDPAEGMVAEARRFTPEATFYVGQAEDLPLPEASVDLVVSTTSFHHWRDQALGVRQVGCVLRPGGCFVLADVLPPHFIYRIIHHGRWAGPAMVSEMFARAGLGVQTQRRGLGLSLLLTMGVKN